MTDSQRIDVLEAYVNEHDALLLHVGDVDTKGFYGLGLRPGALVRTLREAIDAMAGLPYAERGK